ASNPKERALWVHGHEHVTVDIQCDPIGPEEDLAFRNHARRTRATVGLHGDTDEPRGLGVRHDDLMVPEGDPVRTEWEPETRGTITLEQRALEPDLCGTAALDPPNSSEDAVRRVEVPAVVERDAVRELDPICSRQTLAGPVRS